MIKPIDEFPLHNVNKNLLNFPNAFERTQLYRNMNNVHIIEHEIYLIDNLSSFVSDDKYKSKNVKPIDLNLPKKKINFE